MSATFKFPTPASTTDRRLGHAAQDLSDMIANASCYLRPLLANLRGGTVHAPDELETVMLRSRVLMRSLQRVMELAEARSVLLASCAPSELRVPDEMRPQAVN